MIDIVEKKKVKLLLRKQLSSAHSLSFVTVLLECERKFYTQNLILYSTPSRVHCKPLFSLFVLAPTKQRELWRERRYRKITVTQAVLHDEIKALRYFRCQAIRKSIT